ASILVLADALGVLDRDELAVVAGRRLVPGGRRDFARDLARRLDQGADLFRADTQLWHGSSVLKRRTEGAAWAIHVRRSAPVRHGSPASRFAAASSTRPRAAAICVAISARRNATA